MKGIRTALLSGAMVAMLGAGCSNVTPRPVIAGTNPDGLRFYMTRPFVAVNKAFPIQADVYLASAEMSADGKSVRIVDGPQELMQLLGPVRSVAAGRVLVPTTVSYYDPRAAGTRSDPNAQGDTGTPEEKPADGTPAEPKPDDAKEEDAPESERVAMANVTATTDITALPKFVINDTLSLVYLPDYDREFVVETKNKLGLTKMTLNLGPGNTLLGFSSDVDNSALGTALVDGLKQLIGASTGRILPFITGDAKAQGDAGTMQGRVDLAKQSVTLRVHRVKMAAPGLYPLVKPAELHNQPGDPTRYPAPGVERRYLQPIAGYQVPYDYYEVLLFEALLGDVPGLLALEVPKTREATSPPKQGADCAGKPNSTQLAGWWTDHKKGLSATDQPLFAAYDVKVAGNDAGPCHADVSLTLVGATNPPQATRDRLKELFLGKFDKVTVRQVSFATP